MPRVVQHVVFIARFDSRTLRRSDGSADSQGNLSASQHRHDVALCGARWSR
ncbi:hypothetical protein DSM3645_02998 [Blastopirellula marina DSM 3645]|uniref:Uncharacterized protein n=1 Tax=Blastopirellula marina DSM 3645 TaxID=314230 RepID=A3ZVR3_9BACT|nr:hypothetical protein DSM3645_02998 [Blastopirellula marina DSM 3645]